MKLPQAVSALIFACAALFMGANTAVVGEGIVLGPASAINPLGRPHTVTATLQDSNGQPIVNREVIFQVVSGPNANLMGTSNTNSMGKASFTYFGLVEGTDTIEACFTNSQKQQACSNQVTKTWIDIGVGGCTPGMCCVCHKGTMTLPLVCGSVEYRRHVDHGDAVGTCQGGKAN